MSPPADLIDSHCHLTMEAFDADRDEVLGRARAEGVSELMVVSSYLGDAEKTVTFARSHEGVIATAGVHPHDARGYTEEIERTIGTALDDPLAAAVGEIGLDYHYDRSPREAQREAFRCQIRLARRHARPIVIHTRAAPGDTIRILEEENAPALGGIFHCFTEDAAMAAWALENGYLVSFSGIVTFTKSAELRDVAKSVPLERSLIETDAPYLAPVPMRGKRNEPANVRYVAACLAELHGVSAEDVGRVTAENFRRLFRKARNRVGD